MNFLIADTFTDSLAKLIGDEQKAVKTTAFDLQVNPASPGMSFHKLDAIKDKNFWSVRVSTDIRIIVHKTQVSLLLCYVDHHDKAYDWAKRRKLETHPKTGAAQLVEIRETVKEIIVPTYVPGERPPSPLTKELPLFASLPDNTLLSYGVPQEWLSDVKRATQTTLWDLADRLPSEAAEALLELATGGSPATPEPAPAPADPFSHPDAKRRFRVMSSAEELKQALDYPWEKWTVFLHPQQRQWVERSYAGPARVSGSAGTGKTIVALHRAAHLAKANPQSKVLLTTFSASLANALKAKLAQLLAGDADALKWIEVIPFNDLGLSLYAQHFGKASVATNQTLQTLARAASKTGSDHKFSDSFILGEWQHIVDAWQLSTWESYRDVTRLGRKNRLNQQQRATLWAIFEAIQKQLTARKSITQAFLFTHLAAHYAGAAKPPYDFIVVDEAQDLSVAHVRFLAALGKDRPNSLFFAGDLGQRIFQQPFSWKALGIDVRGRSRTLRVNYRTSHQIRAQADRLLETTLTDPDGNAEKRSNTVSVFNGPPPAIQTFKSQALETKAVAQWLADRAKDGILTHEMAVFVRSDDQLPRAKAAVEAAKLPFKILSDTVESTPSHVSIGIMHLAKGLEFRAVAVLACDDQIIPSQERIATVGDTGDLQEVYDTERHLVYVACTRARDHLLVTGTQPASEFLDDLLT